ncbi:MAG: hypothetical protein EB147_04135, partial [Acidimicrobiia bacterium]|nr:hypothetical protein [Acidimicrobiia bacterium]
RNADSFVRLTLAAENDEVVEQYSGGLEARRRDIENGSTRSAREIIDDLRRSIYSLEGAWAGARRAWFGRGRLSMGAEVPISDLPLRRWREVEVHAGDLGLPELGLDGPDTWSMDYVRFDLPVMTMQWKSRGSMGLTDLPAPILGLAPARRLGWLMGRVDVDGVEPASVMG